MIVFERAGAVFVFNFHPTQSFSDYRIGVDEPGEYSVVLSTDDKQFAGQDRVKHDVKHVTTPLAWNNRKNWMHVSYFNCIRAAFTDCLPFHKIYIPCRTAIVLATH